MSVFSAKIVNNGNLTVVIDGTPLTADTNHINYQKLRECIKANDADEFLRLYNTTASIQQTVNNHSSGKAELRGDVIYYDGQPLHNEMTNRMLHILSEGEDIGYLLNFIEKLMKNPSKRAIDELYKFLSHKNLPITEDGDFLAYKCVRENYLDKHSGTYDNSPGAVLEMARNAVDDNCNHTCSHGFHAGSLEYSGPQGSFWNSGDRVIIVRINPADVVSIPSDYNGQKLRTCKYTVVADYKGPLSRSVYSGKSVNEDDYDADEYDDEAYDDDESDVNNIEFDDLAEGDLINFVYNNERRNAEVCEIDFEEGFVRCELVYPEKKHGEFRSFKAEKMSDIILEN
jgi:hypothetical protein